MVARSDLAVGDELPGQTFTLTRLDLVRYCGASGDFNTIHWNQRVAVEVGLPDVIAHGMLTMATVARVVTDWTGDPGAIVEYGVRFTRPVPVPDDGVGAAVEVTAKIVEIRDEEQTAVVDITAKVAGQTVLARARAVVRLS